MCVCAYVCLMFEQMRIDEYIYIIYIYIFVYIFVYVYIYIYIYTYIERDKQIDRQIDRQIDAATINMLPTPTVLGSTIHF